MSLMNQPFEVIDRVWFGSCDATNKSYYASFFTHIVNCAEEEDCFWIREFMDGYICLNADDQSDYPIIKRHLDDVIAFVDKALENSKAVVYIHCFAGQNRSATIAIAYASYKTGDNPMEILARLQEHRPNIVANPGFYDQLVAFGALKSEPPA